MKNSIQLSHLQKLIDQRNGYLVLAAGLLLLCIFLSVCVLRLIGRERVVITPPVVHQSFWVGHNEVSPEYLSEMTQFLAQMKLTQTPSSTDFQRETLLRYTDPKFYGAFKDQLVAEADHLKAEHITLAFYPVNLIANAKALSVQMTGDLSAFVGNTPLPVTRVTYQVRYRYDQGRLLLKSFEEIKEIQEIKEKKEKKS